MVGRITLIAVLTLLGLQAAQPAWAQDGTEQGSRRLPLGERLQRLRSDLFGEPSRREMANQAPQGPRKMPPRGTMKQLPRGPMKQAGPQMSVEGPTEAVEPAGEFPTPASPTVTENPYVTVPPYLETQGIRPARPGAQRSTLADEPDESPALVEPIRSSMKADDLPAASLDDEYEPAESGWADSPDEESGLPPEPAPLDDGPLPPALEAAPYDPEPNGEPSLADPSAVETGEAGWGDSEPLDSDVDPEAVIGEQGEGEYDNAGLEPEAADAAGLDAPPALEDESRNPATSRAANRDEPAEADADGLLFRSKSPVLAVEASGPRTVTIGKEADFVVRLRNTGAAANNVVVSIRIPSTADVAAAQPSIGTAQPSSTGEQGAALEWTIDHLAADSEERLRLKLIPRDGSPLDLAFRWTFAPEPTQTLVEVQEPKLEMSLTGPNEVLFGETKLYKLTIANPGNGDTENVSVGLLPIGRAGDAPASHRLGTLRAGESKTIDIELTARQAGSISIKAQAFADAGLRAEASQQVLVRRASLQVEVEAPRVKYAGTAGTYRVKVANVGNAMADNVHVAAVLPEEAKFLAASSGGKLEAQQGRVVWKTGALQAGGERVFELQCALNTPGDNRVQFVAEANGDLSATANASTRVEAIADLKLEVRDPQGPVAVGDEAEFEVHIRNRGTKAAENVELVVFFSEGLEASSADGGQHDIGPGQVVFRPIAAVGAGEEAVFHIRGRAETNGNHVFRAEVNCASLNVKLATEEVTHFYGEPRRAALDVSREPRAAAVPENLSPPAEDPYADDPTPAEDPYAGDPPPATQ